MKKMFNAMVSIMLSMLIICYGIPNNMTINKAYAANKVLTGQQIANYCNGRVGQSYASNSCLAFVRECFMALGAAQSSDCCAWNYGNKFCTHSSRNDIPIGADVFFTSVGCAYDVIEKGTGHHCGHIGIYVGDGYIVHAYSSKIQKMKIDTVVSHGYTYRGWGIHGNVTLSDVPLDTGMSISGATVPSGNLKQGSNFGIYGTIYSNLTIKKVWGGIYQQGTDTAIQYVEESAESTSYDLHGKFNNNLIFDNLAAGNYTYKIYAKDSKKSYTLISSDFSVGTVIKSSMSMSGQTIPSGSLKKGSFFGIYGNISSNLPISLVWGGVYKSDWTVTSQYTEARPNTTSYSLYPHFDNNIVFNGLAEGTYHYLIKAKDTSGTEYTLINSEFTIGTPIVNSSMSISGQTAPSGSLQQGKFFAIKGIISSNLNITKVWGGVYNRGGSATAQYAEASPNSTKYDLSTYFDNKIVFNNLAVGYYTYKIQAKDSSGKEYTLINSDFQIGNPKTLEFDSSDSSVSINGIESKNVTFSYKNYDGAVSISWEHGDNRATTLSWGEWSNSSIPLTITGYAKGTETITVSLKDSNSGKVIASKTVKVTVTGIDTKLNASTNSVSVNIDKNERKSVTFSYENVPASTNKMNIRFIHGNNIATTLEWGGWENHTTALYITGYRTGTENITIEFFDSETQEILAKQIISVKVTGTPQISASANSVILDYNAKTTKDVKISLSSFPYNCSLKCVHGTNTITSYKWNGWDNGTNIITLTPTAPGTETLTIQLVSPSNEVILSTKINVTVTAKLKITFDACGGIADFTSKNVTFGDKYGSLATVTYDDYVFEGWFTETDGGSLVTSETIVNIKSDQTLYAHWTKNPDPLSVSESSVALNIGEKYSIVANQSDLTYISNNETVAIVSPDGELSAISEGNAIISIINPDYEVVQIKVTVTILEGDCDSNGRFDVDDVVLLQQWLLAVPETHLANWKAADLCEDDKLDVFDLCKMRALYAEKFNEAQN